MHTGFISPSGNQDAFTRHWTDKISASEEELVTGLPKFIRLQTSNNSDDTSSLYNQGYSFFFNSIVK